MKKTAFIFLFVLLMNTCCFAASPVEELANQFELDLLQQNIPPSAQEMADELSLDDLSMGKLLTISPQTLWDILTRHFTNTVATYKKELLSILASVLLCAILSVLGKNTPASSVFGLISVLSITTILSGPVLYCLEQGARSIRACAQFMLVYVPVYATVVATGGAPTTAAVYHSVLMIAAQIVSQLAAGVFLPMTQSYMMLSLAGGIGNNVGIVMTCGAIKKIINWGLVMVMTAFTGLLSLQSFLTSAADGAAIKTAKFLVGSFIPVVGSVLTDALSAMQGSLHIIKASVGSFGILVAVLTFLPVLLRITVLRAVVAIAAIMGEMLSVTPVKGILSGFSNLLSIMTAILLSMMMLLVISTAVMLSLTGGTGT
ncbi:MAG: stage III sporulation protein AE [Candidatus Fimivivens sp.]